MQGKEKPLFHTEEKRLFNRQFNLRIPDKYSTVSRKLMRFTTIVISIVLKFFSHRKHLAKLDFGFVAVLNSEHTGQRKRKNPSDVLDGNSSKSAINTVMGMSFLSLLSISAEQCFFIFFPFYGRRNSAIVSLTSSSSIFWLFSEAALMRQAVAILLICLGIPPE